MRIFGKKKAKAEVELFPIEYFGTAKEKSEKEVELFPIKKDAQKDANQQ